MSLLRKALAHENSLPPVDLGTSRTLYYRHENALCMRRILTKIGAATGQVNLVTPLCPWFLLILQTLAKARLFILSALTVKNIAKHRTKIHHLIQSSCSNTSGLFPKEHPSLPPFPQTQPVPTHPPRSPQPRGEHLGNLAREASVDLFTSPTSLSTQVGAYPFHNSHLGRSAAQACFSFALVSLWSSNCPVSGLLNF